MKTTRFMLLGIALITFGIFLFLIGDEDFLTVFGLILPPVGLLLCLYAFFKAPEE